MGTIFIFPSPNSNSPEYFLDTLLAFLFHLYVQDEGQFYLEGGGSPLQLVKLEKNENAGKSMWKKMKRLVDDFSTTETEIGRIFIGPPDTVQDSDIKTLVSCVSVCGRPTLRAEIPFQPIACNTFEGPRGRYTMVRESGSTIIYSEGVALATVYSKGDTEPVPCPTVPMFGTAGLELQDLNGEFCFRFFMSNRLLDHIRSHDGIPSKEAIALLEEDGMRCYPPVLSVNLSSNSFFILASVVLSEQETNATFQKILSQSTQKQLTRNEDYLQLGNVIESLCRK